MLLGLAGLTASGVSFWAVVSRLTLTTVTEPAPRALKLGVPSVVVGASRQAVNRIPKAASAADFDEPRICVLRGGEGWNRRPIPAPCNLAATAASWRLLGVLPPTFYLPSPRPAR